MYGFPYCSAAGAFLDGVAANLTGTYMARLEAIRANHSNTMSNLDRTIDAFGEFQNILGNITSMIAVTETTNDLNRQTLRQAKVKKTCISIKNIRSL